MKELVRDLTKIGGHRLGRLWKMEDEKPTISISFIRVSQLRNRGFSAKFWPVTTTTTIAITAITIIIATTLTITTTTITITIIIITTTIIIATCD